MRRRVDDANTTGKLVRIVLSTGDADPAIGREYAGDDPEGEFVALPNGAVGYR